MSKEELIEEIYLGLSAVSWGFQPKDAEELITRIGKAYIDGELELPGEVGRTPYRARVIWDEWLIKVLGDGVTEFIALRKEEKK